ncbi:MAG: carbamoyl-phosphate synthase small subunit, partial [Coriobacteriales bacterium]|nr:carbamoyl-phosphate synthase small subunit [Coriobacteriales bacterium]
MKTENTTAQHKAPALLMLEDGTCFEGVSCGATGEVFGEVCFNTAVVGYLEIISDPSYTGQILVMTYPQIGNYGVARADLQSEKLGLRGLVAHDINETPSNFRSEMSLPEFLATEGVVAISQVDTRALTQHIRDNGSLRAVISTSDLDRASLLKKVQASTPLSEQNVTQEVSCKRA